MVEGTSATGNDGDTGGVTNEDQELANALSLFFGVNIEPDSNLFNMLKNYFPDAQSFSDFEAAVSRFSQETGIPESELQQQLLNIFSNPSALENFESLSGATAGEKLDNLITSGLNANHQNFNLFEFLNDFNGDIDAYNAFLSTFDQGGLAESLGITDSSHPDYEAYKEGFITHIVPRYSEDGSFNTNAFNNDMSELMSFFQGLDPALALDILLEIFDDPALMQQIANMPGDHGFLNNLGYVISNGAQFADNPEFSWSEFVVDFRGNADAFNAYLSALEDPSAFGLTNQSDINNFKDFLKQGVISSYFTGDRTFDTDSFNSEMSSLQTFLSDPVNQKNFLNNITWFTIFSDGFAGGEGFSFANVETYLTSYAAAQESEFFSHANFVTSIHGASSFGELNTRMGDYETHLGEADQLAEQFPDLFSYSLMTSGIFQTNNAYMDFLQSVTDLKDFYRELGLNVDDPNAPNYVEVDPYQLGYELGFDAESIDNFRLSIEQAPELMEKWGDDFNLYVFIHEFEGDAEKYEAWLQHVNDLEVELGFEIDATELGYAFSFNLPLSPEQKQMVVDYNDLKTAPRTDADGNPILDDNDQPVYYDEGDVNLITFVWGFEGDKAEYKAFLDEVERFEEVTGMEWDANYVASQLNFNTNLLSGVIEFGSAFLNEERAGAAYLGDGNTAQHFWSEVIKNNGMVTHTADQLGYNIFEYNSNVIAQEWERAQNAGGYIYDAVAANNAFIMQCSTSIRQLIKRIQVILFGKRILLMESMMLRI